MEDNIEAMMNLEFGCLTYVCHQMLTLNAFRGFRGRHRLKSGRAALYRRGDCQSLDDYLDFLGSLDVRDRSTVAKETRFLWRQFRDEQLERLLKIKVNEPFLSEPRCDILGDGYSCLCSTWAEATRESDQTLACECTSVGEDLSLTASNYKCKRRCAIQPGVEMSGKTTPPHCYARGAAPAVSEIAPSGPDVGGLIRRTSSDDDMNWETQSFAISPPPARETQFTSHPETPDNVRARLLHSVQFEPMQIVSPCKPNMVTFQTINDMRQEVERRIFKAGGMPAGHADHCDASTVSLILESVTRPGDSALDANMLAPCRSDASSTMTHEGDGSYFDWVALALAESRERAFIEASISVPSVRDLDNRESYSEQAHETSIVKCGFVSMVKSDGAAATDTSLDQMFVGTAQRSSESSRIINSRACHHGSTSVFVSHQPLVQSESTATNIEPCSYWHERRHQRGDLRRSVVTQQNGAACATAQCTVDLPAALDITGCAQPGAFERHPAICRVLVEPFGFRDVRATTTVAELIGLISQEHFCGNSAVHICVNDKRLPLHMHVVDANMLGVIRVKAFPLLGGGLDDPAKQKLVSLLEAKGVAPQEVQSRVQQVVECLGVGKVKQVLAAKDVWGALKQEATRHNLVLVSILEREAFMQQNTSSRSEDPWDLHDPWRDATNKKGKGADNVKKGKGKGRVAGPKGSRLLESSPEVAEVDVSFFRCADGAVPQRVTEEQMLRGMMGLCVMPADSASKHLSLLKGPSLSADELGLLSLGQLDCVENDRCRHLIVPAWVEGKPAALRCTLVQLGSSMLEVAKTKSVAAVTEATTVAMVHIFREEAAARWSLLARGCEAFLCDLAAAPRRLVAGVWNTGFFSHRGVRVAQAEADYFHAVLRIPDTNLSSVLRLCGLSGLYIQTKGPDRGRDPRYRVIKVPGADVKAVQALLPQVPEHFGVVKLGAQWGIRVSRESYKKCRETLFPELGSTDEDEALIEHHKRFFILNVPDSIDRRSLRQVFKQSSWKISKLKPDGFRTWVAFAPEPPDHRTLVIGSDKIVVLEDHGVVNPEVVAAGASSQWKGYKSLALKDKGMLKDSAVAVARVVAGPVATKLEQMKTSLGEDAARMAKEASEVAVSEQKAALDNVSEEATRQNARIEALEAKLEIMGEERQRAEQDSRERIERIENEVANVKTQVETIPGSIQGQMQQFFAQMQVQSEQRLAALEKSNKEAYESLAKSGQENFQELKDIFSQQTTKRHKAEGGGGAPPNT